MNGDNMLKELIELLGVFVIFIGVMGIAYWMSKKIGMMNKEISFHKNMKVVEILPLMQGQYLYIVKVGTTYHLMGCSQKGNMVYLKEVDEAQLNLDEIKNKSFQEHFVHFMKRKQEVEDEYKE